MQRVVRVLPLVVAMLLVVVDGDRAFAAEVTLTGGRSATLKNKPGSDRDQAKLAFQGDPGLGTLVDPRCGTGNATRLGLASSVADAREITLPCELWTSKGTGYDYRDKTASHGGVEQVRYTPGKLQVVLKGAAYRAIAGPVDALEMRFTVGATEHCGRFTSFRRNDAASIAAKGPTTGCQIDPLLGSRHGGSAVWDYCADKYDDTPVPADPRSLVQPGVNAGKAVHFNAYWKNCHVDPEAVGERGAAATCGELRERFWKGDRLLDTGGEGVGGLFTATDPAAGVTSTFSAAQFNAVWLTWGGFLQRPDNFDELVAERYGSGFAAEHNPYPKPGEDPTLTNGGSGRLPEMFTQMRNADGSWSGEITVTCHACHSGSVGGGSGAGPGMTFGGGSSLADLNLFLRDFLALGYEASVATTLNLNRTRGRNNASLINLAFAFAGIHAPDIMLGILTSGSTADMDTPAWWNMGHRPVKFVDGVFPMDAPRVDMVFYAPFLGITPESQAWMAANGPDLNTWIEALESPPYPFTIDTGLAREGSRLFHTLDMWAPERANPIRRPEGNGSCASCHGAYAPLYANDPAFLDTPAFEGIASYIAPLDIIGTDPERVLTNNEEVQQAGATSFFGYPETAGTDQDCGPQNRAALRGDREIGYLAPPLYGAWATAPYFHNGAVPNVWEVLKPSARQPIWRRVSRPARPDQAGHVIMGYDTDLARAYDSNLLGWRYDVVPCELGSPLNPMVSPYVSCDPDDAWQDPLAQQILSGLYSNILLTWNILFPPILTNEQMEDRKNFNTRMFAQSNAGHEFNAVLTDAERLAIVEYLKTL